MPLVQIIVALVIVGVVLWLIETQLPMDAGIKVIIKVVVILAVCLWLLSAFGLLGGGSGLRISR